MEHTGGLRVGSIGAKLALLVVALVGATSSLVVILGYASAREECVRQVEDEYASAARAAAASLSVQLLEAREAMRALAENPVLTRAVTTLARGRTSDLDLRRSTLPVLARARVHGAQWASVGLEGHDGVIQSSTDPDAIGTRVGGRSGAPEAEFELTRWHGESAMRLRVPIRGVESMGALVVLVAIDPILESYRGSSMRELRVGAALVAEGDPLHACIHRATQGEAGVTRFTGPGGIEHLAAFAPVPETGVGLVAHAKSADAFAAMARLRSGSTWLLVGSLVAAFVAALLLARHFARPVRQLAEVANRVAAGDLTARARMARNDELGMLAADFNRMTSELERSYHSLERRVRERTEELAALNSELVLFSQSVAHDFRTPLRSIAGFSKILRTEKAEMLDLEGRVLLERTQQISERLGRLVEDLLSFAGIGRHELRFERVETRGMVRELLGDFDEALKGRSVEFELRELPDAEADSALLSLVFSNLISNAIKFTRHRERAVIVIGAETRGAEMVYFVRDNGAGFDMTESTRLFELFQRLHEDADFDGTGLGLAISRRIVERHGGRMWAEGRAGVGACFFFTLAGSAGVVASEARSNVNAA